jgi:DNA-directed RNA polymerase specialized sigma24 family protein
MRCLNVDERAAVELICFESCSIGAAATCMGRSRRVVSRRYHRALERLRTRLGDAAEGLM